MYNVQFTIIYHVPFTMYHFHLAILPYKLYILAPLCYASVPQGRAVHGKLYLFLFFLLFLLGRDGGIASGYVAQFH